MAYARERKNAHYDCLNTKAKQGVTLPVQVLGTKFCMNQHCKTSEHVFPSKKWLP